MTKKETGPFRFKQFTVEQADCTMKVGTDGVLLGAWVDVAGADKILDVGTGTGLIALMMAQRTDGATIHGVEIGNSACELARQNVAASDWAERMEIFESPVQNFAKTTDHRYDLIVSNPPFFSGGTFSGNQNKDQMRHTVKLPNGDLLHAVRRLLTPTGRFVMIIPYLEGLRFIEMAGQYHFYCRKMTSVYPKAEKPVERLLLEFSYQESPTVEEELIIQTGGRHEYTEAYEDLTKMFYLDMR